MWEGSKQGDDIDLRAHPLVINSFSFKEVEGDVRKRKKEIEKEIVKAEENKRQEIEKGVVNWNKAERMVSREQKRAAAAAVLQEKLQLLGSITNSHAVRNSPAFSSSIG